MGLVVHQSQMLAEERRERYCPCCGWSSANNISCHLKGRRLSGERLFQLKFSVCLEKLLSSLERCKLCRSVYFQFLHLQQGNLG